MRFFRDFSVFIAALALVFICTACAGMGTLADNLKGGVEQLGDDVAIGKSNALITPYQSFEGSRTSDNTAFAATYAADVSGFHGQDILVCNTDLKKADCRTITVHYEFDTVSGHCRLIYIDSELEQTVLARSGDGEVTVQLEEGANYIGISGDGYKGTIKITVE